MGFDSSPARVFFGVCPGDQAQCRHGLDFGVFRQPAEDQVMLLLQGNIVWQAGLDALYPVIGKRIFGGQQIADAASGGGRRSMSTPFFEMGSIRDRTCWLRPER